MYDAVMSDGADGVFERDLQTARGDVVARPFKSVVATNSVNANV
jgi:hypothetical protein